MTEEDVAPGDTGPGDAAGDAHQDRNDSREAGLAAELRNLALSVLDRVEPALLRMHADHPPSAVPPSAAAPCTGCPVCVVLAVLRGERPELTATLAEQLGGLLAVLRAALEEGDPAATGRPAPSPHPAPASPRRRVQRIVVERVPVERIAP